MSKRKKLALKITLGIVIFLLAAVFVNFIPTFSLKTPDMKLLSGNWVNVYYETEEAAAGRMKSPYDCRIPAQIYASPAKRAEGSMMRRSFAARRAVSPSSAGESSAMACREKTMPSAETPTRASETAQIKAEANVAARPGLSRLASPNIGIEHPVMAEAKRISKRERETEEAARNAEACILSAKTEPKSI